jgi:hypothetical protein
MVHSLYKFFDSLEDKIRAWFSRRPIFYAFIGGIGIVLFWRGVWHTVDAMMDYFFLTSPSSLTPVFAGSWPWWDGPLSLALGSIMLLSMGVFVSEFIGNEIIISGLRREKKLADQTEDEVQQEAETIKQISIQIEQISQKLHRLEKHIAPKKSTNTKRNRVDLES